MAFRVRDLMITALPKDGRLGIDVRCHSVSVRAAKSDLYLVIDGCAPHSVIGPLHDGPHGSLAKVKRQLHRALAHLEAKAHPTHFDSQFKTVREIEQLQRQLQDVMTDLVERKSQMRKVARTRRSRPKTH
jgi:hypothetical protein